MTATVAHYERNAARFVESTIEVDMSALHARFLAQVPDGGLILDAGCGSGRDSKAFLSAGYRVRAFDASANIARLASEFLQQPVEVLSFAEFSERSRYDGIWACASLLHLREAELPDAFARLWAGLKPGGVLYASFKLGSGERDDGERHFTDADEERLQHWLDGLADIESIEFWRSEDRRPERSETWLNTLVKRGSLA